MVEYGAAPVTPDPDANVGLARERRDSQGADQQSRPCGASSRPVTWEAPRLALGVHSAKDAAAALLTVLETPTKGLQNAFVAHLLSVAPVRNSHLKESLLSICR